MVPIPRAAGNQLVARARRASSFASRVAVGLLCLREKAADVREGAGAATVSETEAVVLGMDGAQFTVESLQFGGGEFSESLEEREEKSNRKKSPPFAEPRKG